MLLTGLLGSGRSQGFPSPSSQTGGCGLAGSFCYLSLNPDMSPRHRHSHAFRRGSHTPPRLQGQGERREGLWAPQHPEHPLSGAEVGPASTFPASLHTSFLDTSRPCPCLCHSFHPKLPPRSPTLPLTSPWQLGPGTASCSGQHLISEPRHWLARVTSE